MFLCSEIENLNISKNYFNFIKESFEEYIKFISNYRLITIEYIKKLTQFMEKSSSKLLGQEEIDDSKYQNINKSHIYSITSSIPKLINNQIDNLNELIDSIDLQISNYDTMIKEKDLLFSKFEMIFEEARKDLLKKYRDIDKLKDEFMANMENTEDIVNKYLNRKEQINFEQIKNSIIISKKVEKDYKNAINKVKLFENNFESMYQNTIINIKKIICETSNLMKDKIINFIILLKNNSKVQLSEIDIFLPELSDLNEVKELDIIIENSFSYKNKLEYVKPLKYKLKIFENKNFNKDNLITNPILNLEDGFSEMPTIKDEIILYIFKTMKENFELIEDKNIDLKKEEEKMRCLILTERILSLEEEKDINKAKSKTKENKKDNFNNEITKKDIDELNHLLNEHRNRVVFLQELSEYRTKGKFELKSQTFEILGNLLNTVISTIERDKDFHAVKNVIILSQTYYVKNNDNTKIYLQKLIQNNKLFKSKKFWEDIIDYSISKEIVTSVNNDVKNGTLLTINSKENDDKKSNIAFSQILPYADNMLDFGLDKETINEIIFPIINTYKINEESIEAIKAVINNK